MRRRGQRDEKAAAINKIAGGIPSQYFTLSSSLKRSERRGQRVKLERLLRNLRTTLRTPLAVLPLSLLSHSNLPSRHLRFAAAIPELCYVEMQLRRSLFLFTAEQNYGK